MREHLKGQLILDGAVAAVRSFQWDEPGVHIFENSDYVISRPIARSPGNKPIRWQSSGESGIRPWGAVAIVPPGTPITLEVDAGEVTFISCFFSPDQFEKLVDLDLPTGEMNPTFISNPFLGAVLDRLAREVLAPQPRSPAMAETLVASVTAEIGSLVQQIDETRPAAGKLTRRQLRQVTELIAASVLHKRALPLTELAAHCAMSVRHLGRAFKATTGTTIHTYIRQIRLERIKTLLASGLSMGRVAAEAGFATSSQFSAEFRRLMGCSPSAYRKQRRPAGASEPAVRPQD